MVATESEKQINQMIQFIMNEAKDKAEEIQSKALEDYNIEKLKLIQYYKTDLLAKHEEKMKKIDIALAIARSTAINQARLRKIALREELMQKLRVDIAKKLTSGKNQGAVCANLMAQAMLALLELKVEVRCRKADESAVNGAVKDAEKFYSQTIKKETGLDMQCSVSVSKDYLPDDVIGGVVVTTQGGRIAVDNTYQRRMEIAFTEAQPQLKKMLFDIGKYDLCFD